MRNYRAIPQRGTGVKQSKVEVAVKIEVADEVEGLEWLAWDVEALGV